MMKDKGGKRGSRSVDLPVRASSSSVARLLLLGAPSGRTYRKTRRPVRLVRSVAALVERSFSVCFTPDPGQDGACPSRNLIRKIPTTGGQASDL